MTQIHLDGVALRQHDAAYPFDYSPYAHQIELDRLVREKAGFVAVNDSPTGGGKTSSWLAPALTEQLNTVAIYPTNALITDQAGQIKEDVDAVDHEVAVLTATSETLADKRQKFGVSSNGEAFRKWHRHENLRNDQIIVLTNPDIFVMFCRNLYRKASRAYKQFPFIVVDEFHHASRKERNTLRYLLDELYERKQSKHALEKIAFLSATPDEEQERKFEQAMAAPYYRVTEDATNERIPFSEDVDDGWEAVMPPVDLDIRPAPTFGTAETLRHTDEEETLEFCADGQVAVILDGVHEVKQVTDWLDGELDRRVERIDGFHSERKGEKLENFDVLVSNAAVEVGIDFEIDRLIFAGYSHDRFLQRLGRLRKKEKLCHARCYVPKKVARDLESYDEQRLTRDELDDVLAEVYPEFSKPKSFDWRYSAPEALYHLNNRLEGTTSECAKEITYEAQKRITRHFLDGTGVSLADDDIKRMKRAIDWRVLLDLQWYRGDSVQALVYDRTEETVRSYDLFYLLRYGKVKFFTEEEFKRIVPEDETEKVSRQARYVDGFCTYDGTIKTTEEGWGRSVKFTGPRLVAWLDEQPIDSSRKPRVLSGVKLSVNQNEGQPRVRSLSVLNDRLKNRRERTPGKGGGLLCYPVSGPAKLIKERYNLGEFFFLYPIALQGDSRYSLALGTDALYIHCHVMDEAEGRVDDEDEEFIGI